MRNRVEGVFNLTAVPEKELRVAVGLDETADAFSRQHVIGGGKKDVNRTQNFAVAFVEREVEAGVKSRRYETGRAVQHIRRICRLPFGEAIKVHGHGVGPECGVN
jgi:hypothetical protein